MSKVAKLAWPRLAVVAILAAPASAAAGAEQPAAAAVGAPALAAGAPTAYVTISNSSPLRANGRTVVPINTATNKPGPPIRVGKEPAAIAITPSGKTAYVVNEGGSGYADGTVTPVNTATNNPGPPIRVGVGPDDIAVTPDGKTVYVANTGSLGTGHTVTPISTATNKPGKPINVGSTPFAMAITPDGKTLYVTTGRDTVTPVATATNTPGKRIKVGNGPGAIAITPNERTVYVVSGVSNTVTPINVATNTAGKPIPTGRDPFKIAITPDGKTAYVANVRSDTVTPINTATNTAGKPITVGKGPSAIAITPAVAPAGAPTAAAPAGLPVLTATRPAPVTPSPGAATSAILLINGDRLVTRGDGTGTHVAGILPGAASGLAGTMVALVLGGVRYEVPEVALPYLGRGLNPDLFRVGSLAAREAGGRLPVIIGYRGRPPTLPGVTITHAGGAFYFLLNHGGLGGQFDVWRPLPAGKQVTQNWNAYPLHEGYNYDLVGTANPSPWVPSAFRAGDTLTLDLSPFSDSVPGHTGVGGEPFTGGSYQIDENGKQIAAGNPGTQRGFNGEFDTHVTLSPHPGVVRFALSAALTGPGAPKLSPADQAVWTWWSAHEAGARLPVGWTCLPTGAGIVHPVRSCAAEQMMTLGYGVAGLGLGGSAPPGRQVLHLTVGHIKLAKAAAVTKASVSVSFDGGKTWHPAQVSGHAGHYTAVFTAQAGALVTLRTHATDAAGGSVTETITSAYQVAS